MSCAEGLDVRVPAGVMGADPWSGCCLRFGFLSLDEFLVPTSPVLASYTFYEFAAVWLNWLAYSR